MSKELTVETRYKVIPSENIVESVVDELEALLVQRTKEAREYTMRVFWEAGELLRQAELAHKINISSLVGRIAQDNRISGRQMGERNLWMAVKIFDSFPVFDMLYVTEHGENISLSKVKKMLTKAKPKKEKTIEEIAINLIERMGNEQAVELANTIIRLVKS